MSNNEAYYSVAAETAYATGTRLIVSAAVLFFYEWLVTLDLEINHMWRKKWTVSTWIFAVSRYATLVDRALQLTPSQNKASCTWGIRLIDTCTILEMGALALFTGLRTYALCGRRLWVLFIVTGLAGVPVIINLYTFASEYIVFVYSYPHTICQPILRFSAAMELRVSIISRGSITIADIIALTVACKKAVGSVREASRNNISVPLSSVLVRDGSILFLCQMLLNILQLLMNNVPSFRVAANGSPFLSPLSTILICRFMLSLKQASDPKSTLDSLSNMAVPWSTLNFNHDHDESSPSVTEHLGEPSYIEDEENPIPSRGGQLSDSDIELASGSSH